MENYDFSCESLLRSTKTEGNLLHAVPSVFAKEIHFVPSERCDFQKVSKKSLTNFADSHMLLHTVKNVTPDSAKPLLNGKLDTYLALHTGSCCYEHKNLRLEQGDCVERSGRNIPSVGFREISYENCVQQGHPQGNSLFSTDMNSPALNKTTESDLSTQWPCLPLSCLFVSGGSSPKPLCRRDETCDESSDLSHFVKKKNLRIVPPLWQRDLKMGLECTRLTRRDKLSRLAPRSSCVPSAKCHSSTLDTLRQTFWISIWPCFGTFTSSICKPTRVVVRGDYCYMEQVTEKAGEAVGCRPAPCVLYEPDGRAVRLLAQLVPKQHYLLFPSGGFYRKDAVPTALLEELVRAARTTLSQHLASHDR